MAEGLLISAFRKESVNGILTGFVCRKAKVLTEEATGVISNVVVTIILPFYLFGAILQSGDNVNSAGVFLAIGLSSAMFLLSGSRGGDPVPSKAETAAGDP